MAEVNRRNEEVRPRRFHPYAEYRDSGVEWLGKIPAHWGVKRLKSLASVRLSNVDKKTEAGQVPVKLCNYVDVYYNEFITANLDFMRATATPEQARRFQLRKGDVLITKDSESWDDIAVPALVVEDLVDVLCGYHLAHIRPGRDLLGRLLARQFSAIGIRDQFHLSANGITRFGIGRDAIRTSLFPVAPLDDQRAIARFLDRETAKIDALVAKKERLIELLEEKRTALITRAVTRGLDPDVPMKDSGVEWLGAIPAHWNVGPLRLACQSIETGGTPSVDFVDDQGTGRVNWFAPGDFGDNLVLGTSVRKLTQEAVLLGKARLFPASSIFVVGIGATLGKVGLIEEPASSNQQINVLIPRATIDPSFLANVLLGLGDVMAMMANSATLPILNQQQIGAIRIPIPPTLEQENIASAIAKETDRIGRIQSTAKRTVDLLSEYRAALIAASVTGKIDVRKEAA